MVPDVRRTALIVDYDVWERSVAYDLLVGQRYAVLTASNGASGLRLAEQEPCDVILLDFVLPEMTGLEVLRALKTTDATRQIPVVMFGQLPDSLQCLAQGSVPRPLQQVQVIRELTRVLDLHVPRGERRPRSQKVVLVASNDAALAERIAQQMRSNGSIACTAHSAHGCLRVATAVGPDVVLLDPKMPARLEALLRAHPVSAAAEILRLSELAESQHGVPSPTPATASVLSPLRHGLAH
jgi:CheY-like chemotaxis protein